MAYKRILTIQDISCVGQCSMTVALPILSACGHETCILPTAVLSTHTGGFGKPKAVHLNEALADMWRHWKENDITFDAILVGYLGSVGAVQAVEEIIRELLAPGGIAIVDPAMADHGKLYSGLDEAYAAAVGKLCRRAQIILPNITEAAYLSGMEYRENLDETYVNQLLSALDHPKVVLTGAAYSPDTTGIAVREGERRFHYAHKKVGKSCHGTGDMLAAAFTGALMQGKTLAEAVTIAGDFVVMAIEETVKNPVNWYGVKFEPVLPELIRMIGEN